MGVIPSGPANAPQQDLAVRRLQCHSQGGEDLYAIGQKMKAAADEEDRSQRNLLVNESFFLLALVQ